MDAVSVCNTLTWTCSGAYLVYRGFKYDIRDLLKSVVLIIGAKALARLFVKSGAQELLARYIHNRFGYNFVRQHAANLRRDFQRRLMIGIDRVRLGHPHKASAEERNAATRGMSSTIMACGYVPYHVSPSKREIGDDGCREYFDMRDLTIPRFPDAVNDRHVMVMTDVDYYAPLDQWLSFERPLMMYTFVPEKVAGAVNDGYFTIRDNMVEYTVNGGSTWKHPLWDYNNDIMYVDQRPTTLMSNFKLWMMKTFLGVDRLGSTVVVVDQFRVSENRRIVCMVPTVTLPWWMDPKRFNGVKLERMKPTIGDFNVIRSLQKDGGMQISIGRVGEHTSVEMPIETFESVASTHRQSNKAYLSSTERKTQTGIKSAIAHEYLASRGDHRLGPIIHVPGEMANHFVVNKDRPFHDDDGTTYARRFASCPLGTEAEALYPVENRTNDVACIEGRVSVPQAKAQKKLRATPQTRFLNYAQEFVELVVPKHKVGRGNPLEVEEVVVKQDLPRQRERSERSRFDTWDKFCVKAFQKREAYGAPNHPRNISSVPTTHTLRLAGFTYAFKEDILNDCEWYVPGMTPMDIVDVMQKRLAVHDDIFETDFSRFDGTVTIWLRENVEFAVYKRWVKTAYLNELTNLFDDEVHCKGFTKFGVKYMPNASRLSGSPLTTDGNTVINAFCSFAAFREAGFTLDNRRKHGHQCILFLRSLPRSRLHPGGSLAIVRLLLWRRWFDTSTGRS
jgi:hypothetical protein